MRPHLPHEVPQEARLVAPRSRGAPRLLPEEPLGPGDEQPGEARRVEMPEGVEGVLLRAAQLELRDDVDDTDRGAPRAPRSSTPSRR